MWAWGDNSAGNLGDGTTTNRLSPVQVLGLANVIAIEAGARSLALKSDTTVWQWGSGIGSNAEQVAGLAGITAIAAGDNNQLALKSDGTVWTWLSTGGAPVQVAGLSGITQVRSGGNFSIALRDDGTVWAWGYNLYGQLGNGTTNGMTNSAPAQVLGLSNVVAIGIGTNHALAIRDDGSVWAWGENMSAQMGNGTTSTSQPFAAPVLGGASASSYLYLTFPADFATLPSEPQGSVRVSNPIRVTGIANGAAIGIAGGEYSIGCTAPFTTAAGTINNNDTVCVRQTTSSGCGATTTTTLSVAGLPARTFSITTTACDTTPDPFSFIPQGNMPLNVQVTSSAATITGLTGAAPVSIAGGQYSIGCTASFTAATGTIANGQMVCIRQTSSATNNVLTTATLTIGSVSGSFDVTTIAAPNTSIAAYRGGWRDRYTVFGLRTDGTLFAWGAPNNLGVGAVGAALTPIVVSTLSGITRYSAGEVFSLAVRPEGSVLAWGHNGSGQLGDGTTIDRPLHGPHPRAFRVIEVAAAPSNRIIYFYSLALKGDGTVWAWETTASAISATAPPRTAFRPCRCRAWPT